MTGWDWCTLYLPPEYQPQRSEPSLLLPSLLRSPSPASFAIIWCLTTMALLVLHHSRRTDRYQNAFLAAGVLSTPFFALKLPQTESSGNDMRIWAPILTSIALCASAVFHYSVRSWRRWRNARNGRVFGTRQISSCRGGGKDGGGSGLQ